MDDREINDRLARIERQLRRLEMRVGLPPLEEMHAAEPPPVPPVVSEPPVAPPAPPPVVQPPPLPGSYPPQPVEPIPYLPVATTPPAFRPPVVRGGGPTSLEAQVGLKWAGWVGAVIVVIGAALGVKYAYDEGWFGAFPPAARLALMSLGGFGLIAAGEVVYRRIGALASAGLFGAGVATLFVVSYAGYGFFELYEREPALAMMAVVTLVGAGVAIRGNLVSIAVLSIIGGNVAPILLRSEEPRLVPLMCYLLAMQGVALILAWWGRAAKWWTLRGLALATICLWMVVPVVDIDEFGNVSAATVLGFIIVYAALFQLELILSSLREPKLLTTREPAFAVPVPLGQRDGVAEQRGLGVTFSLLVTAALTCGMLLLLRDVPQIERGVWTIGLAGCCLALGVLLPGLVKHRDPLAPPSAVLGLAIGFRIQAAALVVVAVPVFLSGVWITVAWAVLAVAFALAGASFNLAVSRVAAVVVWMLAAAHLGLWTIGDLLVGGTGAGATAGPQTVWTTVLGEPIPAYFVLAMLIALAGHAIATILRADWSPGAVRSAPLVEPPLAPLALSRDSVGATGEPVEPADIAEPASADLQYESRTTLGPPPRAGAGFQSLAMITDALALLVFVVAALSALPAPGATLAWACYAWALIGAAQLIRSGELGPSGLCVLAAAVLKWLAYDAVIYTDAFGFAATFTSVTTPAATYNPFYNPVAAVGGILLVSSLALAFLRIPLHPQHGKHADFDNRRFREAAARVLGGFAAVLIALWLLTTEIDRYYDTRVSGIGRSAWTAQDFARAKQVAISIAWSLYAVACVTLGFAIRRAGLRYFGLALFAITVGKVLLVDMGAVRTGYRVLSFLGLGLLLLGTSVLYGKLSPLLLRESEPSPTPPERG